MYKPGLVLAKFGELRKLAGTLAKKEKPGVNFEVRSYEDAIDQIKGRADELGLLIYPVSSPGKGEVVEGVDRNGKSRSGTYAEVVLTVRIQSIEDGSHLDIAGFGLGADTQDKAGGKAGTYAFKQALIQGLLMGGTKNAKRLGVKDTDDEGEPIPGGPRRRSRKAADPDAPPAPSMDDVGLLFDRAANRPAFEAALVLAKQLPVKDQVALKPRIMVASARTRPADPAA